MQRYIDADDDFLFEGNSMVHIVFKKEGSHVIGAKWFTQYIGETLPKVLTFTSDYFHQK